MTFELGEAGDHEVWVRPLRSRFGNAIRLILSSTITDEVGPC